MNKIKISNLLIMALLFVMFSCTTAPKTKIKCYAWLGGPGNATDTEIKAQFTDLKKKGIDGLMYSAGQNPEPYIRVGKIAKEAGLEFHTWIPTLIQGINPKIKPEWYAVNGLGESALTKPAYALQICVSKQRRGLSVPCRYVREDS